MIAVYPGSFDPATNGHYDIILRASKLVDKLYVSILSNNNKKCTFTLEERINHLKILTEGIDNIEISSFSGLLVDHASSIGAKFIIRGLRAVTDFEYEFQMALTNQNLNSEIETLFISANTKYLFLSSSVVKEIASFGGNVDDLLPDKIRDIVLSKFISDMKGDKMNGFHN